MYLSTITPDDAPSKKKHWGNNSLTSLITDDIDGARPNLKGYQYINKPEYSNVVNDIEKAQPSKLHQALDKPNFNLNTRDIYKAYPNKAEFVTNRIGNNPLVPNYNLPSYETKPITPPRFIRDSMCVTDIEGTKQSSRFKWKMRSTMNVTDIDGAKAKPEKNIKKPNFMDPRDINKGEIVEYGRNTNPLMPQYSVRDFEGKLVTIGEVEGSKPKVLINKSASPHQRHLNTQDIAGAIPGTVGVGLIGKKDRNEYRNTTTTMDIDGAQAGTLKKGITTMRNTHPLNPSYKWPSDDGQVQNSQPKGYNLDHSKFWGYNETPGRDGKVSRQSSLPPPTRLSQDSDFKANAGRFYAEDDLNLGFSKNAEKFFTNPTNVKGGTIFMNAANPGTINRRKSKFTEIDAEAQNFQKNNEKFYGVSQPSEDGENERKALDPEFEYAATKAMKASPKIDNSKINETAAAYQFNLSRKDIGKPGKSTKSPLDSMYKKNIAKFYGMSPAGSIDSKNQNNSPRSIESRNSHAESRNSIRSKSLNTPVQNNDTKII